MGILHFARVQKALQSKQECLSPDWSIQVYPHTVLMSKSVFTMNSNNELPARMKALVLKSTSEPPTVQIVPTPQPEVGSAVIRILAANVISYMRDIYNGKRQYPFPTPLIPGTSAVARIAAVGPDATKLKPGDLVFFDNTIRSRDDPSHVFLSAIIQGATAGSAKLMRDVYRDGSYAEYCRAPLECLYLFDEKRLTDSLDIGGLGYRIEELASVSGILVPYGGLRDIGLKAGQTIIVAPATGPFGGWAVAVALAMGARVIAMGRNKASLERLHKKVPMPERVMTVTITGDVLADADALKPHGQIDAYFDIGPPEASGSTHIKSCILALRHGAKISFMGGYGGGTQILLPLVPRISSANFSRYRNTTPSNHAQQSEDLREMDVRAFRHQRPVQTY